MREIEKIKKFIDENKNHLNCEIGNVGWSVNNATTELIEEYELLIVYDGEPVAENEIFRVNEPDFIIPGKSVLRSRVVKYLFNQNNKDTLDNYVCCHWIVRECGKEKWLIISYLSIENYLKSCEILNR